MESTIALEQADEVIARYAESRLAETTAAYEACGCRSCTAEANRWIDWLAGDDAELYERLRLRFRGENPCRAEVPASTAAAQQR